MDGVQQLIALLRLKEITTAIVDGATWLLSAAGGPEFALRFAAAIQLDQLARATVYTLMLIGGLFVIIGIAETLAGADRSFYAGRVFRQDVVYALFYQGGFYMVLLWAALANVLEAHLAFLKIEALATLPGLVHWLLYWLIVDFITYWWHRGLHSWQPLWAIHSVHHSQEQMNFISSYRLHPVEQIMQNVVMVAPLLIMGVPTDRWLPLIVAMALFEGVQHSALNWGYGRCYFVFVSPRFHALHHSCEPRYHHRNFGKILSVWDFVFGTGAWSSKRPDKLGVQGLPVPRTLAAQFMAPFRLLLDRRPATAPSQSVHSRP